jgi:Domain of unknown function (DUF4190)
MSYPEQPGGYHAPPPQDHPRATTALVLGILSLVCLQILGPFAWNIGKKAMNEIDASGGRMGGRGQAQAGYVLGIISTVLLGLWLLVLAVSIPAAVLSGGQ